MDNWIRKALETLDKEERIKCYQEAEKCLLREALLIPWGQHHYILASHKKVKGININHQAGIIVTRDWVNAWIEN